MTLNRHRSGSQNLDVNISIVQSYASYETVRTIRTTCNIVIAFYRLTALQQSGLYEVFADYLHPVQRPNGEWHVAVTLSFKNKAKLAKNKRILVFTWKCSQTYKQPLYHYYY